MTLISPPAYLHNLGTYTAQIDRLAAIAAGLMPDGAGLTFRSGVRGFGDLAVTPNGTPNMTVNVSAGMALVKGVENAFQGLYAVPNDGTVNLAIAAAHPTLPRRDLVVVRVRDTFYSGATNNCTLEVITGTAAASPSDPSTSGLNVLILARVLVSAADTAITSGEINDLRTYVGSIGGHILCTSTARPAAIKGTFGYELDTGGVIIYDGTNWIYIYMPVWTTLTLTGTSGWTIAKARGVFANGRVDLDIQATRTGSTITADSAGNVTPDVQIASGGIPAAWLPSENINLYGARLNTYTAGFYLDETGLFQLAFLGTGGGTISSGIQVRCRDSYRVG